jgi:tetratricopeptide (TPR) repeat protein
MISIANRLRVNLFLMALLAVPALTRGQKDATVREYLKSFPTYPFSDPSPVPLLNEVYPYFRYDGFTDKAVARSWKVVELENDYIRLLILPEIGGKIWAAIEKSTGRSFLYYNHTVKFRDIAMRGPWTSGGLEANYGIVGHTPNCATPVDYVTSVNGDGSVSCTIGTLDLLSRSYWRMEIRLPKDQALFSTNSCWYNTTALEQPYYHWMNAGLKAGDDLEFIYPGNRYLGHAGQYADWPVDKSNGKNLSWYKNNDFGSYKSYHVFGKYTEFNGVYWHNEGLGMARYGTHDDKAGKKLWIWGLSRQGMIWEKLLTDTDGQYIELQSGRLFIQNEERSSLTPFKHHAFSPYGTETWHEDWFPVLGTRGMVKANQYGALNVLQEGGWLKILFSPVRFFRDTVRIRMAGKIVYEKACAFSPLALFADSIRAPDSPDAHDAAGPQGENLVVTIGDHHLIYDNSPQADSLSRPVDAPAGFDWTSAYGYFLSGYEAMDQKNYPAAETALRQSLLKDPHYGPALVKSAELYYRNMRYAEALEYALDALRVNTEDGPANFIYGLISDALGHKTDAKDGFDIASLDPACRSAAYACLAKIYLREKDPERATDYAEKALDNNRFNMEALQLKAICARLTGAGRAAEGGGATPRAILAQIDAIDRLNHFSRFEKYLADSTEKNKHAFLSLIRNELPQQTFLELGIWYYDCGLADDALAVFSLSPPCAEISLWINWLTRQPVAWAAIDPVGCFPFRSETGQLLENFLKTSDHWLPKYLLALLYHDRNRIADCKKLLLSCGDQPGFAPFYVFRAAIDSSQAQHDLQRAVALDPQWRYQKLLAEYYIIRQERYPEALTIAGSFFSVHPDNYIMGMLYAKTLLLNQQFAAADKVLGRLDVIPFEGATSGHELYREAKLMQAVQQMKQKNYRQALVFIRAAEEWPENLGVGKPYDSEVDLRLEKWMSALCLQGGHRPAAAPAPPAVAALQASGKPGNVNERVVQALEQP